MKTTILLNLVVLLLTAALAPAATRLVPDEYATIQAAIDAAVDGDVVIIAPDTYTGDGNRDIDFKGKAITVRSTDPEDPAVVTATVIDCQGTETNPHRGFKFHSGEGPDSVLAGLTITNGYGPDEQTAYGHSAGGGIFILSSPTIANCVISNSRAKAYGGGVYVGGHESPKISHCTITGNSTGSYGGGIYCKPDTNAAIDHCIINGNSAHALGGGICCPTNVSSNSTRISHCTITNNWASRHSGGIDAGYASIIDHCIIWGNNADDGAPDMSGRPSISYSNVGEDVFAGIGNISVDPCFIDPSNGDYHLSALSACVNAGDPCYNSTVGDTDMDGEQRVTFGRIDIGADEFYDDGPFIYISPTTFVFEVDEGGGNPEAQILSIRNAGNDILSWEVSEECSWLEVDPNNGESAGEIDEAFLNVDVLVLDAGLYSCELMIADPCALNRYQIAHVTLHIDDGDDELHVPSEYGTIQGAVDWAEPNDTVIVADGIYTGEGNRDIDFLGKVITVRSESGAANCIIDCQGSESEPHRGFIFQNEEGPNSALTGLTIMNGYASRGGGIYCTGYSSPTINRCIITDNTAQAGGGVCTEEMGHCSPIIKNCLITGNSAGSGGGIFFSGDSYGWSRPAVWSYPRISNCTISDNSAAGRGGGICGQFACDITINNNIIWGNTAGADKEIGICLVYDASNPKCKVSYSNVKDGLDGIEVYYYVDWGEGNIDVDPFFVEPGYWDADGVWVDGDYHLAFHSPCIDAGDPNYPYDPNETDLDGRPRVIGGRIDMGAYEFNHIPVADAGPDREVYAWIDGIAEVILDGTGSFDDDGHPLTYVWSWTIGGQIYDANGVSPTIELPVGEQTIELIVNDGIDDSEPDEVVVTVIEPVESQLRIAPRAINRRSRQPKILALLRLPEGVTTDQIDSDPHCFLRSKIWGLLLYPGGIEAIRQRVIESRRQGTTQTSIFALFDKAELMDAVSDNGSVELQVVGQLKTGQYFYGTDTVLVTGNW